VVRLKLVAEAHVGIIKNTFFGASAMDVVVLQEILELCQSAATNHLAQQQEQPVNVLFLRIFKRRLDAVVFPATLAS